MAKNGKRTVILRPLKKCEKCQGGALQFEPGEADAESINLKSLALGPPKTHRLWGKVQAGLEFSGCPTPADSHFLSGSSISLRELAKGLVKPLK